MYKNKPNILCTKIKIGIIVYQYPKIAMVFNYLALIDISSVNHKHSSLNRPILSGHNKNNGNINQFLAIFFIQFQKFLK